MNLNSQIILCKGIKIDRNYKNTLSYNTQNMLSLCEANKIAKRTNYSFIRTNNSILVDFRYQDCLLANYIAFQNPDYSNKWFFAWIDEVNYKNDSTVELKFTVDAWSTWWTDWIAKQCFVIREHVNSDSIGEHTVPENLETGPYTQLNYYDEITYKDSYVIFAMSEVPNKTTATVKQFGGIYSGLYYLVFTNILQATLFILNCDKVQINDFQDKSYSDAIISIFLAPKQLVDGHLGEAQNYEGAIYYELQSTSGVEIIKPKTEFANPTKLAGDYVPKNNKLFTYPYRYLILSNNSGTDIEMRYEDFKDLKPQFIVYGVISTGCSIKCVPTYYKNSPGDNYEESINCAKFPVCSWTKNTYLNWLTQNSLNLGLSGLNNTVNVAKAFTGDVSGAISSVASSFQNLQQIYEHSKIPDQARGNLNSSDIMYSLSKNGISIYHMSIKSEYSKIIDQFFTRFGYKINCVKQPNIYGRTNFNFVQIGSGEIVCEGIPEFYANQVNQAFQNGVTIWHSHNAIGNFSIDNSIV